MVHGTIDGHGKWQRVNLRLHPPKWKSGRKSWTSLIPRALFLSCLDQRNLSFGIKKSKKGRVLLFYFSWIFFPPIFIFLSTTFPITQWSHHGETEINNFPKCLKAAILLTNQTSPRTDWCLLVFPMSTKDQQARFKHHNHSVHWALAW